MNNAVLPYLKAYVALAGTIATALLGVYAADSEVGKVLTVVAVIATAFATWQVPNLDPVGRHQRESVQPPERGATTGETVLIVLAVIIAVVVLVRLL